MKYIFKALCFLLLLTVLSLGIQACGSDDDEEETDIIPEQPAMTIFNDSRMDFLFHYFLDADVEVDIVLKSGDSCEIESGVTEIIIDGAYI